LYSIYHCVPLNNKKNIPGKLQDWIIKGI
jgi:hypothetical protein